MRERDNYNEAVERERNKGQKFGEKWSINNAKYVDLVRLEQLLKVGKAEARETLTQSFPALLDDDDFKSNQGNNDFVESLVRAALAVKHTVDEEE